MFLQSATFHSCMWKCVTEYLSVSIWCLAFEELHSENCAFPRNEPEVSFCHWFLTSTELWRRLTARPWLEIRCFYLCRWPCWVCGVLLSSFKNLSSPDSKCIVFGAFLQFQMCTRRGDFFFLKAYYLGLCNEVWILTVLTALYWPLGGLVCCCRFLHAGGALDKLAFLLLHSMNFYSSPDMLANFGVFCRKLMGAEGALKT